jgi:hypothetical protein
LLFMFIRHSSLGRFLLRASERDALSAGPMPLDRG